MRRSACVIQQTILALETAVIKKSVLIVLRVRAREGNVTHAVLSSVALSVNTWNVLKMSGNVQLVPLVKRKAESIRRVEKRSTSYLLI